MELLIALTIVMLIAGALASLAEPARAAFDRVPAELDLQQRGRTAIDVLSQALRSTIGGVTVGDPSAAGDFGSLMVTVPIAGQAVGVEQYTFRLSVQTDGSLSLIRETSAGAIQPVIDFVSSLGFTVSGSEVDIVVRLQATTAAMRQVIPERVFRSSIRLRNAS
jgi:Tfp pilus assembly protein PilW